jgi:hypothetical protein
MVLKVVIQQSTFNITYTFACVQIRHNPLSGGYCGEVPPLPIPNREVKLTCADGTAMQCGRVGSRLLLSRASDFERFLRLFCFHTDFKSVYLLSTSVDSLFHKPSLMLLRSTIASDLSRK